MTTNEKPVFESRLRQIRASVFRNTSREGKPYFNTQLVRRYQTADKEWANSGSFTGVADLLMVRHLIDEVLGFLTQQSSQDGEE